MVECVMEWKSVCQCDHIRNSPISSQCGQAKLPQQQLMWSGQTPPSAVNVARSDSSNSSQCGHVRQPNNSQTTQQRCHSLQVYHTKMSTISLLLLLSNTAPVDNICAVNRILHIDTEILTLLETVAASTNVSLDRWENEIKWINKRTGQVVEL